MYQSYWKLTERPFENTTREAYFFASQTAQNTLLKLRYAVENRRGIALLSGASGLGKSLLTTTLLNQLPEEFSPKCHLIFPQLTNEQFIANLSIQLGYATKNSIWPSMGEATSWISNQLAENTKAGRHAVIAIDEAQLLEQHGTLESIRLLSNLETNGLSDLTLLIVGQTDLLLTIQRIPALEERIGVKCLLSPLTREETIDYVQYRLQVAGSRSEIFQSEALKRIFDLTEGVSRRINRLCDLALLIGFAEENKVITADQVEALHDELVSVVPE